MLDFSQRTLIGLLQQRVQEMPDAPLYSFLDKRGDCVETLSFSGLYAEAQQVAQMLRQRNIRHQPVLLCYPHGSRFVVAFFACMLADAWPVPLAATRGRHWNRLDSIVQASQAEVIMTTSALYGVLSSRCSTMPWMQLLRSDDLPDPAGAQYAGICPDSDLRPGGIAFIQYTSGSTSNPKGVVITHDNVMHNSMLIRRAFDCSQHDTGVCWLPLHHDMGLIGHVVQPLFSGIHNYFMSPVDFVANPLRWLDAIARYGGTISGGPDFAYAHSCARISAENPCLPDLSRWRIAYSGSERVLPATVRQFSRLLAPASFNADAFFPCYGLAESTLFVSGQRGIHHKNLRPGDAMDEWKYQQVGLGTASHYTDIRIIDPDTAVPVGDGVTGEICIRSKSVAAGYYLDAHSDSSAFNTSISDTPGYFRTGDLGRLHEGVLYFDGRLKNCIKRRGCAWFSEDIEVQVERSSVVSGISRCVALNVVDGDQERLVLLLELRRKSHIENLPAVMDRIRSHILERCGIVVDDICFLSPHALPLTSSGKLRREACRRLYDDQLKTMRLDVGAGQGRYVV